MCLHKTALNTFILEIHVINTMYRTGKKNFSILTLQFQTESING